MTALVLALLALTSVPAAAQQQPGTVVIDKSTNPAGDTESFTFDPGPGIGSASEPNFDLADGTPPISFTVAPGTYTVEELAEPGWSLGNITCFDGIGTTPDSIEDEANRRATFVVAPGERVACAFHNRKLGRVVIDKSTTPAGDPALFTFDPGPGLGAASEPNFDLADGSAPKVFEVDAGNYTVEELVAPGWTLASIVCVDGPDSNNSEADVTTRSARFSVDLGETVTCTFNNRQDPVGGGRPPNPPRGTLTIEKQTLPDGSTGVFGFDGPQVAPFDLQDDGKRVFSLLPGTYEITEDDLPAGWTLESIVCGDGSGNYWSVVGNTLTVTVSAFDDIKCVFTNERDADDGPPPPNPPGPTLPLPNPLFVQQSLPSLGGAAAPIVQQQSAAQRRRVFRATSRLRGPSGCVRASIRLSVRGDEIRRVTFYVDGKKVGTRTARTAARTLGVSVSTAGLSAGVHRVRARVVFSERSGRGARDHRMSFQRCQAPQSPRFTG